MKNIIVLSLLFITSTSFANCVDLSGTYQCIENGLNTTEKRTMQKSNSGKLSILKTESQIHWKSGISSLISNNSRKYDGEIVHSNFWGEPAEYVYTCSKNELIELMKVASDNLETIKVDRKTKDGFISAYLLDDGTIKVYKSCEKIEPE